MQKWQRVLAYAASAAVMAWAMVAGVAAQTIKIGVIQPLTGAFAAAGTDVTNGAKIAVDEINAKGGVLGKKLELVIEDSKIRRRLRPSPRSS
jgi:branched-chain amino acid transport system substrate-binding protein